jgi:hypothetical protein
MPRCSRAFQGRPQKPTPLETTAAEAHTTTLLGEEPGEFAARMGKWSREALAALQSESFWVTMSVNNLCRQPIADLMQWLQGQAMAEEDADSQAPLVEFVTCRAAATMKSLEWLLSQDAWSSDTAWGRIAGAAGGDLGCWRPLALATLLSISADVHRRISMPTSQFPMKVAWLVAVPPGEPCEKRRALCLELSSELVATLAGSESGNVDSFTALLRHKWRAELQAAGASSGRVSPALHAFVLAVCRA